MTDTQHDAWNTYLVEAFNAIEELPGAPFAYGETIIYYDGPRVFWLQTNDGRALLVEAADETDDDYIELAVTLAVPDLESYLRGDLPLREAWTNAIAEDVYLIHHPMDDTIKNWAEQAPHPLAENLLPAPDARLGLR